MEFTLPQNTVFYQLEKAIKVYRRLCQDHINNVGYDITINQLILLTVIAEKPDATQVELSEYVFKDFASIVRMVDLLVKKGFLLRTENSTDRRKKDLRLTKNCQDMIRSLIPVIQSYRNIALEGFSNRELNQLTKLLNKLTANCEEYNQAIFSR